MSESIIIKSRNDAVSEEQVYQSPEFYYIPEDNMERLEKKLQTLKKKCELNHAEFNYEVLRDEFKTWKDDNNVEHTIKYKVVRVKGEVKHQGWRFVATLEHLDKGNVVRQFDKTLELPEKFLSCGPKCEHCNKIRSRKDTYVVYNDESHEFRQVARNCLKEYTQGLSAENIAFFASIYDALSASTGPAGGSYHAYYELEEVLRYAAECVAKWGYHKRLDPEFDFTPQGYQTTRSMVLDNMRYDRGGLSFKEREAIEEARKEVNWNLEDPAIEQLVSDAVEWIRNEDTTGNTYLHNLQMLLSVNEPYVENRDLGILVSLIPTYYNHLNAIERKAQEAKNRAAEATSEYVGEVGERISIDVASMQYVTSFYGYYGDTYLYKFVDTKGNVLIWYSSKYIDLEEATYSHVIGTVKSHETYKYVKQTTLTRCKLS